MDTLNSDNIKIYDMPRDGSCLFHAVSFGILRFKKNEKDKLKHSKALRTHAVNYIENHFNEFKNYIDESEQDDYIENMRNIRTFGDEICLMAIAKVFDLQINVYHSETLNLISTYEPEENIKKTIHLLYDPTDMHYQYIIIKV